MGNNIAHITGNYLLLVAEHIRIIHMSLISLPTNQAELQVANAVRSKKMELSLWRFV